MRKKQVSLLNLRTREREWGRIEWSILQCPRWTLHVLRQSQNSELHLNMSYSNIGSHTTPHLTVLVTQCDTLTCFVLDTAKLPVCQNTLYRSQWASALSCLDLNSTTRALNLGCSKYLQKFSEGVFPTEELWVFSSDVPLVRLNPLYLSLSFSFLMWLFLWFLHSHWWREREV